jgi:hypothetical protein
MTDRHDERMDMAAHIAKLEAALSTAEHERDAAFDAALGERNALRDRVAKLDAALHEIESGRLDFWQMREAAREALKP